MRIRWILLVVLVSLLAACGNRGDRAAREILGGVETRLPSPTPPVAATQTATPSPSHTPAPSPTGTSTPTDTPTATPSPSPSPSPTETPTPTETPAPTDTATPAPPTATPLPPPTPTPSVDFRLASWRLWPLELNSGCEKGMHNIFIIVQDANGAPLDGVVVGDSWNNVEDISGRKGSGRTEINLWANAMEILVKRDGATGEPYTSEVSPPSGSFFTDIPNEQLAEAGYCANVDHCQWMKENDPWHCGGHYSWEIIFQRTY